jgi:ubiquitin carboxyl-terminal hydrolase 17
MLKPTSFKKSLIFHHQKYDNKNQHDAHEFLLDTLTMLDYAISKKYVEVINELTSTHWIKSRKTWKSTFDGKKSFITDEFFGQYVTKFKCNSCQEDYFKYDPFCCVYLTLRDPREEYPLQFLIDKHFESDYFNVTCQRECNIDRQDPEDQLKPEHEVSSKIIHLPETLIFVIKRYDNIGGKTKSKVTINESITLDKHFHNISSDPVVFNFKSAVFHDGDTIDSGHYYSCVKRKTGYKIFDDTKIFGVEDINTIDQSSSYILFYERVKN